MIMWTESMGSLEVWVVMVGLLARIDGRGFLSAEMERGIAK
jgi:hypothetical protein